jgi:predicted CoA-binding protein
MISRDMIYAVVGASANPTKYGHKVLKDFKEAGYNVTPINPKGGEILGLKVFESLSDMKKSPDVVITVVPPRVTEEIVKEAKELGIANVWMQPGSESEKAVKYCEQNGISCIHNACIMVQRQAKDEGGYS